MEKVTRDTVTQGIWVLTSLVAESCGAASSVGRIGVPLWQKYFDLITGNKSEGLSLSDLSKQLDKLAGDIEESTEKIIRVTERNSTLKIYGDRVDTMNACLTQILNTIKGNAIDDNSDQDKLVFAARAIGEIGVGNSNVFLANFEKVTQSMIGTSKVSLDGMDLFQAAYEYYKEKHMFSGEAIDASKVFIADCFDNYMYSYAITMHCLDAYRQVLNFTEEDKAALSEGARAAYGDLIKASHGTVLKCMETLSEGILGKKKSDGKYVYTGVAQHYADYEKADRFVFVNKGKANVHLNQTIVAVEASESSSRDDLNKALNANALTAKDVEDLVDYINNEWKGGTIQTYLKERGFNFALLTEENREQLKKGMMSVYEMASKYSGSSFDREKKAEEIDANVEAGFGTEKAKEIMKHTTYLAAGKQTMFTTSEHRTKSWSTITKEYYRGYNIRTNGAARKDVLHYTSSGSNHYRTNTFLVFQSK